jgi:hypothetical protein
MLNPTSVEHAVEIHALSYKLLKWLNSAIHQGFVPTTHSHGGTSPADAAAAWVHHHYHNLPLTCRPRIEHIEEFGRFFGTYLDASFDLLREPEQHLLPDAGGCLCPICRSLSHPQYLKPKSLTKHDKARAAKLRARRVETLALEENLSITAEAIANLAESERTRRDTSLSAYGASLLDRLQGFSAEPAVLALWRDIAWDRRGAPLRNFKLKAADILNAEQRLLAILTEKSTR